MCPAGRKGVVRGPRAGLLGVCPPANTQQVDKADVASTIPCPCHPRPRQASSPLPEKKNAHEFQDILPGKRHFWALEFFLGWFPRGHLGLQLLCVEPERRKEPWACRGPWAKAQAHHGGWASHPHPGSQGPVSAPPLLSPRRPEPRGPCKPARQRLSLSGAFSPFKSALKLPEA